MCTSWYRGGTFIQTDLDPKYLSGRIKAAFPELFIESARPIFSGAGNSILLVNGNLVFKFPRTPEDSDRLEKEIDLMNFVQDSPLPVPKYRYKSSDGDGKFGGYQYIEGIPLTGLTAPTEEMKLQLSRFLSYLYHATTRLLERSRLVYQDGITWGRKYMRFFSKMMAGNLGRISQGLFLKLEDMFSRFETDLIHDIKTSVIHGDLYRGNVLVDQGTGRVTGIIDWGFAEIGDPALDFAALAVDLPLKDVKEMLRLYAGTVDRNFMKRMEFYWRIEPLYGLMGTQDSGSLSRINSVVEVLNSRLNKSLA